MRISKSCPNSTVHLAGSRKKDWLAAMQEQIFGAFREGLVAVYYHLDHIRQLERAIADRAETSRDLLFSTPPTTLGLNCRPLNAEYQAFKFAVRRTLEYLAGAVAMFFKTDGTRIRKLATTIDGREPTDRARPIQARLAGANLEANIGTDDERSVRDLLAHYRSIDAGVINIQVDEQGQIQIRVAGAVSDSRLSAISQRATSQRSLNTKSHGSRTSRSGCSRTSACFHRQSQASALARSLSSSNSFRPDERNGDGPIARESEAERGQRARAVAASGSALLKQMVDSARSARAPLSASSGLGMLAAAARRVLRVAAVVSGPAGQLWFGLRLAHVRSPRRPEARR
jgi:hypothetical protein